ncbi:MAG: ComF family protein, partial [Limnochordia bacterium]
MRLLRYLVAEARQMLFAPETCYLCGRALPSPILPWMSFVDEVLASFCEHCLQRIPWVVPPLCDRCGCPTGREGLCSICRSGARVLKGRSPAVYDGVVKRLLGDLKFKGVRELARPLGYLTGVVAEDLVRDWRSFAIVPIPLHSERLVERGFNQADLLAESAARVLRRPVWRNVLERKKATSPQTRLSASERRINMAGAFAVPEPGRVTGRRFL